MRIIPFQVSNFQFNVMVVIEDENLERMKAYDPAQLAIDKLGFPWSTLTVKTVLIVHATPADLKHIDELARTGQAVRAVEYMSKGFTYDPGKGDNDDPYKPVRKP